MYFSVRETFISEDSSHFLEQNLTLWTDSKRHACQITDIESMLHVSRLEIWGLLYEPLLKDSCLMNKKCNTISSSATMQNSCQFHLQSTAIQKILKGGRNSSVGSAWARCPQRRGFDPPLGTFSVEGIFPLELTWVQTPFPQKLFRMSV